MQEHRGVAAVVDDQRRARAVGPLERLRGAPPVLLERLALPGEDRDAARVLGRAAGLGAADDDRGGGVVLGREDVARDPAHVGAEQVERLDQHGGLHGHVQAAHDARAGQRRLARVARAQRHQPGHLLLGEADLVAPELGEPEVGDLVGQLARAVRRGRTGGCRMRQPSGFPSVGWTSSAARRAAGRPSPRTLQGRARPARRRPRASARRSSPACVELRPRSPARPKPSQTWPMVRRYSSYGWGRTSATTSRPPGRSTRATSASASRRIGHVVQEVDDEREVERLRTRAAAPRCGPRTSCDVAERRPAARARRRASRATRRRRRRSARRARASRRCAPSRSRDRRRRRRGRAARAGAAGRWWRRTARRAGGPTRRRRRRRTPRVSRSRRRSTCCAPAQVEAHGDRVREALAHELPEPPRALVEPVDRERVAAARAVAPRAPPSRRRRAA